MTRRLRIGLIVVAAGVLVVAVLVVTLSAPSREDLTASAPPTSSSAGTALDLSGFIDDGNAGLDSCRQDAPALLDCGPAPAFTGITQWLNTPGGAPVSLDDLRGRVVLVDFFSYSCINCLRSTPHVVAWQQAYGDAGLVVVGIHSPQWLFETEPENVVAGLGQLGITYPVAMDDDLSTRTAYRDRYLPAQYLVDSEGTVRNVQLGEGNYAATEEMIRELLVDADPGVQLPAATDLPDETPDSDVITPEAFFGWTRVAGFAGPGEYGDGAADFTFPVSQQDDTFALDGAADIGTQSVQAVGEPLGIRLYYTADEVRMVLGGSGVVAVTVDGRATSVDVSGAPRSYRLTRTDDTVSGVIEVSLPPGVQAYSFAFGGN